jgi:hypothetical protein
MTMLSSGHDGSRADAADGWVATRLLRGLPADRGFLVGKHCTDRSSTSKSSFSPSPSFTSAFRRADTNSKRELPRDRCLSCTKCPGIVLMLRLWSKCLDHSSAPHFKSGFKLDIARRTKLRSVRRRAVLCVQCRTPGQRVAKNHHVRRQLCRPCSFPLSQNLAWCCTKQCNRVPNVPLFRARPPKSTHPQLSRSFLYPKRIFQAS